MRKEQLAALHLHPRVKICEEEFFPKDYDDYDNYYEEPQKSLPAGNR